MASVPLKQVKFNNGEITPLLQADTSLPKYGMSLRTCKNWLPISQGAVLNRPGTRYTANTKSNLAVRTRHFLGSDGVGLLLEFGNLYMRSYLNGVLTGNELVTPWTSVMLQYLKFDQVGNVLGVSYGGQAGGNIAPREITYTPAGGGSTWAIRVAIYALPPVVTYTLAPTLLFSGGADFTTWTIGPTFNIGDRVRYAGRSWISIQQTNVGNQPDISPLFWQLANDENHPAVPHTWGITFVVQDSTNGRVFETPVQQTISLTEALALDRPISLFGHASSASYTILYVRLYRSTNNLYGLIEEAVYAPVDYSFVDRGRAPDYTVQPPLGTDPFLVLGVDSFPAVVMHFDQRRYFADSPLLPQTLWGSAFGNIIRFDRPTPGADQDSVMFTVDSEVFEQIRSMITLRVCLVMTGQGEWTLRGSQGAAVTRSNVDLKRQSKWGSSWRDAIIIGNGIIFNTAKNNMVRDLYPLYGLYTDVWDGDELSWQARHFMDGHTVVDWAFQSTPYAVVWLVRDDGLLLSLTYDRKREVVAWAQHPLGGAGVVENVSVVAEPPEDAVYLVVKRVINGVTVRYHERLNNLIPPGDIRQATFLDATIVFNPVNPPVTVQLSGGTYLAGTLATATAAGASFAAALAGTGAIVFDRDGAKVRARIVGWTSATVVTVEFDASLTAAQIALWVTAPTLNWVLAQSVYTVPQLDSAVLDSGTFDGARGITVFADGEPVQVVSLVGQTLTLTEPAVIVQVGFSYNCDLELLDAYHPQAEIRNRFKRLLRMGFNVASSRGLWVGQDFTNMDEWEQREVSDSYGTIAPGTGYFEQLVDGDWNKAGRAAIRQWQPLPVQLLGVLREMEIGGT